MGHLNKIRPVLFLFYMVETVINIILFDLYLSALAAIQETPVIDVKRLWYLSYLLSFYFFTVMTLFASVNVCTKNQISILEEVVRTLVAFIAYTILTLLALYDAETDFPLMFPKTTDDDLLKPDVPLPHYFHLLRSQATASLTCSVFYLLHCLIALDVLLSNEERYDAEGKESECSIDIEIENQYQPVQLFVLGSYVHRWFEKFQWFRDYISEGGSDI